VARQRSPVKPDKDIEKEVQDYLDQYRERISNYLRESVFPKTWTSEDTKVADHIAQLKIPVANGDLRLVLHDLGGDVVHPNIVDQLFAQTSCVMDTDFALITPFYRYFINTSGSGKTRILFEGLWKNWGFYFTCKQNAEILDLGT
jgi:hypothetical protein